MQKQYCIPKHLYNLKQYLNSIGIHPIEFGIKNLELHKEKFYFLINYLHTIRFTNSKYKKDDFIPIDSQKLKSELGDRYYKSILKILELSNIIEIDNYYSEYIGISKRARINPDQYQYKWIREYHSKTFIDRIGNKIKRYSSSELMDWMEFNINKVDINSEAIKFINDKIYNTYNDIDKSIGYNINKSCTISSDNLYNYNSIDINSITNLNGNLNKYIDGLMNQFNTLIDKLDSEYNLHTYQCDLFNIQSILNRDYNLSRNDLTNRVYSVFTSLSSDLRRFILFDGKPLHYIDIKNSQPLILGLYLRKSNTSLIDQSELNQFILDCSKGIFYDQFIAELGLGESESERRLFKADFFKYVLFGKEYHNTKSKTLDLFKSRYPSIYQYIKDLKDYKLFNSTALEVLEIQAIKSYSKADSYSIFSVLLQRLEANIMIDSIANTCRLINLPVITLHDGLYTTIDHIEALKGVVINHFVINEGVRPTLHIGGYNQSVGNTPIKASHSDDNSVVDGLEALDSVFEPKASVNEIKTKDRPPLIKGKPNLFDLSTFMEKNKG